MVAQDTFYCKDAAAEIADMYQQEEVKYRTAQRVRDRHRAETSMRAYKEALRWVLLEHDCASSGQPAPMPDVETYLRQRSIPTV